MTETWIAQQLVKGLLRSLLLTEVLELLAAACFPQRNRHDFLLVIFVNILTNPVVVYLDFWLHGATITWIGGCSLAFRGVDLSQMLNWNTKPLSIFPDFKCSFLSGRCLFAIFFVIMIGGN